MQTSLETKTCSRCGESLPLDSFYFVSKKLGTRRGKCKSCMAIVKAIQKDPNWRPACSSCGVLIERFGPGRRLCRACFDERYESEDRRSNGAHRLRLKPCSCCGEKRLRADHTHGASLCPICRSVSQGRRKRLKLYNLTPRMFLMMLEDQGYRCWICDQVFTKSRVPHVDHRHAYPMLVRGLLCASCNTILGLARDNPDRLGRAATFLERPPTQYLFPGLMATEAANRANQDYRPLKRVMDERLPTPFRPYAGWRAPWEDDEDAA